MRQFGMSIHIGNSIFGSQASEGFSMEVKVSRMKHQSFCLCEMFGHRTKTYSDNDEYSSHSGRLSFPSINNNATLLRCLFSLVIHTLYLLKNNSLNITRRQTSLDVTVMLLHNIDQTKGLCNGTRLQVLRLTRTSIQAQIINANHFENEVIIPRLRITPTDKRLPLNIRSRQYHLVTFVCYDK